MKWQEKDTSTLKQPNGIKWWYFYLHLSHKVAKSMAKTHQWVIWWSTASFLLVKWRWSYLKSTRVLVDIRQSSETSHNKNNLGIFQHQYLAELLVNVCSYCLMIKSASCCCVCGRWIFSNLITFYGHTWRFLHAEGSGGMLPRKRWNLVGILS